MYKFALLTPSRERPQSVERLLQSLSDTTTNPSQVEILFAIDNDDSVTRELLNLLLGTNKYSRLIIKPFYRDRAEMMNRDYYNWLAEKSNSEFIWAIGDDIVFLVSNWDTIIYDKLQQYLSDKPDKIVCAGIKDTTPKPKPSLPQFPCFPLVSRVAFQQMGFVLHPFIPTWGADYLIYLLYTGANRYLEIADRDYLHHVSVHTKTASKDMTAQRVENIFNQLKMNDLHNIDLAVIKTIPPQVEELKQKIIQLGGKI